MLIPLPRRTPERRDRSEFSGKNAGRARLGAPVGGTAALEVPHPLRQELMKLLRCSPFRFLRFACLLHSPSRSCLTCRLALATVLLPSRHALMYFLRASPFSFFSPACLLQALMRSCACFDALPLSSPHAKDAATTIAQSRTVNSLFIGSSLSLKG